VGSPLGGTAAGANRRYNQCELRSRPVTMSKPRHPIDFDTVRRLAHEFAGVEDSTTYGSPTLKVRGKLLACLPSHKSAEAGSLVVCISFDDRAELIAAAPDVYYLTDHYLNYPSVLVRLSRIESDALKDLLGMAWSFVMMKSAGRARTVR